jgi:osmotically inducible protein OsmC
MPTTRKAEVDWLGGLMDGEGKIVKTSSGKLQDLKLTFPNRLEEDSEMTSPEELIAAGLAGCYAMSVAHTLNGGGWEPEELKVGASLSFEPGRGIVAGTLTLHATVESLSDQKLWEAADLAKRNCPVVNALSGVDIQLDLPGVEKPVEEAAEAPAE